MEDGDLEFLALAIEKATESVSAGGFPAGAVLVSDGAVVGSGISIGNLTADPTAHAEMTAIREACAKLGTGDLSGATLYASLQPCAMCLAAAVWASVSRIVYACAKEKVSGDYYGHVSLVVDPDVAISLVHAREMEADVVSIMKTWEEMREASGR
jgi:tRNA(Arg) A34 adenosine deaminase TadA